MDTINIEHELAPAGTRQGAWNMGDNTVRFALWAPGKQSLAVMGPFNDWNREGDVMKVGDDGLWWLEKQLPPGEHRYLFVVDGETVIGDPYAKEVDWNAEGPHALVRVGEEDFAWDDGDYGMPEVSSWVIYEAHVGHFTPAGTFQALTDKLDYLHDLGVNALELMPIFEFPGDHSWGYNPVYTFAPARSYGSLSDLKELINEAHKRGIAVVLDVVFNHVGKDHPFMELYPYEESPFFSGDDNPWGFPDLNHWSDAVKSYVHAFHDYWLNYLHIDGFRYDATAFIKDDGVNGVSFIAHDAHELKSHAMLISEYIPEEPGMIASTRMNAGWNDSWHTLAVAQVREGSYKGLEWGDMETLAERLDPKADGYSGALEVVRYLESHDQARLVYEVRQNPDAADRALQRSVLGAALLLSTPGIPMLYMGQEFATATSSEELEDDDSLSWEALEDDGVKWLFECYQRLIWLRREHPALRSDGVAVWQADNDKKVLVYRRSAAGVDAEVIIMLNFSPSDQDVSITLPRGGKYHEVLTAEDWSLPKGEYNSVIPGSTARVLKRVS